MENLINKIFPSKCLFCGSIGELFCENCMSNCEILKTQRCVSCDQLCIKGFTHARCLKVGIPSQLTCVYEYKELVRECIRKSKYYSKQFMALVDLVKEAVDITFEWNLGFEGFTCVPIPLAPHKEIQRGFNQAELIARVLSRKFKIPMQNSILTRIKDTKAQHEMNRRQRFANMMGSFSTTPSLVKGKKVLLVDDISTTGATFIESSKVLYEAGAKEVRCFALSKKLKL